MTAVDGAVHSKSWASSIGGVPATVLTAESGWLPDYGFVAPATDT